MPETRSPLQLQSVSTSTGMATTVTCARNAHCACRLWIQEAQATRGKLRPTLVSGHKITQWPQRIILALPRIL